MATGALWPEFQLIPDLCAMPYYWGVGISSGPSPDAHEGVALDHLLSAAMHIEGCGEQELTHCTLALTLKTSKRYKVIRDRSIGYL